MALEFKQTVSGDTYNRWHSECDMYIIAQYYWKGNGREYKVHPHFQAYYLSMHFKGSEDLKTYNEAVNACLKHQEKRNETN